MKSLHIPITLFFIFIWSFSIRAENPVPKTDSNFREAVKIRLEHQRKLAEKRSELLFGILERDLMSSEREALEFLLAYAPLSDLADYDGVFFLESVQLALKARREMPWGGSIPEDVFRHFVLPPRVNNENMDRFRVLMYDEIKNRVRGLPLREAALEINHWCHEKVVYQSTDERTSAPLSTISTAFGRCGEESTFTVSALRTAGIPARQCYTPRWAHVDDNHAWVEVWVDGSWYYMGACEPEPVLNKGWFDEPVKRAMMVHTRTYGQYFGTEPVLYRQSNAAMLNLLHHYTRTAELSVTVLDEERKPVSGADVRFQLYNYAEFYTLLIQKSDPSGQAHMTTGLGDLLIWAYRGDRYGFAKATVRPGLKIEIVLNHRLGDHFTENIDFTPPVKTTLSPTDPATGTENDLRSLREDEIRNRYIAGFIDKRQSRNLAVTLEVDADLLWKYLKNSRGNWMEIKSFLEKTPGGMRTSAMDMLGVISEKDLRDAPAFVLADHLKETSSYIPPRPDEIFTRYVLNPRVANENLRPYRRAIRTILPDSLKTDADGIERKISEWIEKNIRQVDDDLNHYNVPLTPAGVLSLGVADRHSLNIFAVALCRSIGLPSRLEPGSLAPQLYQQGRWLALWPLQKVSEPAKLTFTHPDAAIEPPPKYYIQFTLGRFRDGNYDSLEFPFDTAVGSMPKPLELPAGHYRLVTGVRLGNDDILTRLHFFTLERNQEMTLPLVLRNRQEEMPHELVLPPKMDIELIGTCERGSLGKWIPPAGAVLAFVKAEHEPSRHLLDDLTRIRNRLEKWDGAFILVLKDRGEYAVVAGRELNRLPKKTLVAIIPSDQSIALPRFDYPCCLLLDNALSPRFVSTGYRTGTDNQLLRAIAALSDKE